MDHKLIKISVKDTGIGIKEEDISKLFKNFGKLESHNHLNPNGIGLGLKICKQIAQKLGGNIEVESQVNKGTTFTFSFKNLDDSLHFLKIIEEKVEKEDNKNELIQINDNESPLQENNNDLLYYKTNEKKNKEIIFLKEVKIVEEDKTYNKNMCRCSKLLIVDDDLSLRNILSSFALKCNIEFDQAEDGLKALALVKEKCNSNCCKTYKLIFMDMNMPFMNGIEASLNIHNFLSSNNLNSNTSIILLSGIDEENEKSLNELPNNIFCKIEAKPLSLVKLKNICQ